MNWLANIHARSPRLIATIVAIVTGLALVGLPRVQFDDDPRAAFRATDETFRTLDEFYHDFGADDQDVYLVIDGTELFTGPTLTALRRAYDAVRALPEVESVASLFEVHKPGPVPLMLMPAGNESSERLQQARQDALAHPVANGHFLSHDGQTTLMSVRLAGTSPSVMQLGSALRNIREAATPPLEVAGLRLRMAGHPAIRVDLLSTLRQELLKFTTLSAIVAGLISLAVFRSPRTVAISIAGPLIGLIWVLGGMAWLGVKIDPLSVVLPTLIFVVGFTDTVHLLAHTHESLARGESRRAAAAGAVRHLGPACLLTAVTTAIGFGSLAVAEMACVGRFGVTCAIGTLVMFAAVQLVIPALVGSRWGYTIHDRGASNAIHLSVTWLEPMYRKLLHTPRVVATVSVVATVLLFLVSLRLKSDQRWTETLPEDSETVQVTSDCDRLFGGSTFAHVVVEWPAGRSLRSPEVLSTLAAVHDGCQQSAVLRGPFSVLTLLESLCQDGESLSNQVRRLRRAPPRLLARFYRPDLRKAVVSLHAPDIGAAVLAPEFAALERQLASLSAARTGYDLTLTGTEVVAARNVYRMISDLARSLTLASVLIFAVISVLFRSLTLGLLSIVPNVLPQSITAALLVAMDVPLSMTSVLTFSLCLGLSVDDTVHFLMRYRDERRQGVTPREAVTRTFRSVGGVMLATSFVLIGGFAVMLVSHMPGVRMFAFLSAVTMLSAILGDLIMLPSLILAFGDERGEQR